MYEIKVAKTRRDAKTNVETRHVFMTTNGTLKFVKAPEHEGKAFRPIIGRLRAPLAKK